jgi:hypothetical protein
MGETACLPEVRPCSRCHAEQRLTACERGMGAYRCGGCGLVVGFDLLGDTRREWLAQRGQPWLYTRGAFGKRLARCELRL